MQVRKWRDSDTDSLQDWIAQDPSVDLAVGQPQDLSLEAWLEQSMPVRATVVDADGETVALVGLSLVFSPHIVMAPNRRGGKNVLVAARAALNIGIGIGVPVFWATPRKDNEESVKLCESLGLEDVSDVYSLMVGRVKWERS